MILWRIKNWVGRLPLLGRLLGRLRWHRFDGSAAYWDARYRDGGDSGVGSQGAFAAFKAEVLNAFVAERGVRSVVEFGCGDGRQLGLADYPRYLGLDVSEKVVDICRERFAEDATKTFRVYDPARFDPSSARADLALSLDVVYHLVEDEVFETYMRHVFVTASRFAVIYSTDRDERGSAPFIRHRRFSAWVEANCPGWALACRIPNRLARRGDVIPDFYVFEKRTAHA